MQETPYPVGYKVIDRRTRLKRVLLLVVSALIGFILLLLLYRNGIVDTSTIDTSYTITLYRIQDGRVGEQREIAAGNRFAVIGAGRYAVQIAKEGTEFHYSSMFEVKNFARMSKLQLARMSANVGVDTLIGAIPFAGDAFDFFYRSNSRNLKIIRKHLDKHHPQTRIIEG